MSSAAKAALSSRLKRLQKETRRGIRHREPLVSETVRAKWFDFPRTLWLMLLPLATLAAGVYVWIQLPRSDWKPYAGAAAIFGLAFAGLAYSLFPYIVMDRLTIWQAAAHESALAFLGIGALFVLPFIAGYQLYSYRIFRGKVKAGTYEH